MEKAKQIQYKDATFYYTKKVKENCVTGEVYALDNNGKKGSKVTIQAKTEEEFESTLYHKSLSKLYAKVFGTDEGSKHNGLTFGEFHEKYKKELAHFNGWRESTQAKYSKTYENQLTPLLNGKPMRELTFEDYENAVKELCKQHFNETGKEYSRSRISQFYANLWSCAYYAFAIGICPTNPIPLSYRAKKTIDEIIRERLAERSLTDSENHNAFVQIRNDLLRGKSEALGLACMLFTGIRPEEVIALDFGDIIPLPNSDTRIINVYKSYDTTNNIIEKPKSENGYRRIPEHFELKNLVTSIEESLKMAGYKDEEIKQLPLVSSSSDLTQRCSYDTLRVYAKEVLINAGVKQEIIIFADILAQDDNAQDEPEPSTYLFRRSFATYSRYYCGFTVSELKYIMGHKDDSVDLPLYQVYCTNENQEEIKTKLEKWQVGTYTPGQKITPEDRTEEKQDEETSVLAKTSATNDDNQRDQILTTEEPDDDFNDNLMPTSEQPGDDYNDHQIPGNYIFLLTSEGRIRKTPISEYPRRSRNTSGVKGPDFKNNDYFTSGIKVSELDNIYVITDKGNIYLLSMLNIPVTNRTNIAKTATENIFKKNSEKIMIAIHDNRSIDNEECYLTTVTRFGRIQRTNVKFLKKLKPYSKDSDPAGIKLMTLNDGDSIVSAFFSNGNDNQDIIICTQKGKGICFSESAIRETGKNTKGISAINLSENDVCIGAAIAKHDGYLFTITKSGYGKCTSVINPGCWGGPQNVQNRGGRGKKAHNLDENGELAAMAVINRSSSEEIALISSDGHICRFKTEEIPISSRETSGSRLMNLRNSSNVSIINIIEI